MLANPILESRLELLRLSLDALAAAADDNLRAVLHRLTCDKSAVDAPLIGTDEMAHDARERCLLLLAKEHLVASDLKYAMSALRVGQDYERIHELAEALNNRIPLLRRSRFKEICKDMTGVMADILAMHDIVRPMLRRNQPVADLELLKAQQAKLSAGIQLAILGIQSKIMSGIASEKSDPEAIVEIVLACRHLKRIAGLLVSIPEELSSFG